MDSKNISAAQPNYGISFSISILLAGDNPVVTQSLAASIQKSNPDWAVDYVYLSGRETIDKAAVLRPDIILIDLKINSPDTIPRIRENVPDTEFICIYPEKDYDVLHSVMKMGIRYFFTLPLDKKAVLEAINECAAGIIEKKLLHRKDLQLLERIESASRIIRKDYLMSLMPGSEQNRRQLYYANFLGLTDQPGFVAAILCLKNPTYKLPEAIIYRLSTQFEVIGTSVEQGLGIAFFPVSTDRIISGLNADKSVNELNVNSGGPTPVSSSTAAYMQDYRTKITEELDKLLVQFRVEGNELVAGIGNISDNAASMKNSLTEALTAVNSFSTMPSFYRYTILFDSSKMKNDEFESHYSSDEPGAVPSVSHSLEQAIRYIEMNYSRELTLSDVAATVNLSPCYFSRVFKKYTGLNFSRFLTKVRIEKAKKLLADDNASIKKVAYLVGFNDPNYFSKVFHEITGVMPSECK